MNREELGEEMFKKICLSKGGLRETAKVASDIAEQYAKEFECKIDLIEILTNFQLFLNDKKLINNHDWDYEKEAKLFIKKYKLLPTPPQKQ